MADHRSRRAIMGVGVALWSVMTMLSGVAHSYGALLAARIGVGIGEATLVAPAVSLVADYFPRERRASALSVYSLGIFLGSGLAYFIGGAIVGVVSNAALWHWPIIGTIRPWQSVFIFVGAPGLVVALLFATVREPARDEAQPIVTWRALGAYLSRHRRTFLTHSLGFAVSGTVNYGIAAWLATWLIRAWSWTPAHAGEVQGILTMTIGVVGTLAGGVVADRMSRRGVADGPLRVGMIGAAGMLVFATAYPFAPTAALAVAALAVVNFFAAFPWGAASAAAAEMVPREMRAQGAALYFLVLNLLSGALGPTAVALVTDHVFGAPSAVGYSLAIVNAVGMAIALVLMQLGRPAYAATVAALRDRD
jgi:MFS family permease